MPLVAIKNMLLAQDMDRAMRFYTQVFGLTPTFTSEYWSELSWGDAIVALHGGHDGSRNSVSLSLQVSDIQASMASVMQAGGAAIVEPLQREGEPIWYSEFKDPEGNVVMMTQYVGELGAS